MSYAVCGIECHRCDDFGSWGCEGCNESGPKVTSPESACKIRKCAKERGLSNCAECADFDLCEIIGTFHAKNPQLRKNLLGA